MYYQQRRYAPRRADAAQIEAWVAANPAEWAWMEAESPRFEFAKAMVDSLLQWGRLTEKQMATVQRLAASAVDRKAAATAAAANAPVVEIDAIAVAFKRAKDAGLKRPVLRLDGFAFSLAGETSANAGGIYVKEAAEGTYLGKIMGGRFQRSRDCNESISAMIVAAAADPANAAKAYGKKFGKCSICARDLSDAESVERGIGPVCASKFGF